MMDINESIGKYKCLQCTKQMKKIQDLKKHIQKNHAKVPEFRCVFCPENKPENRFSTMKRDHMYQVLYYDSLYTIDDSSFQHINAEHANVRTNGETDKSLLDSCKVEDSLLWRCYGV